MYRNAVSGSLTQAVWRLTPRFLSSSSVLGNSTETAPLTHLESAAPNPPSPPRTGPSPFQINERAYTVFSTGELLRKYAALSLCRSEMFVRNADKLVSLSLRILGPSITAGVVRRTFFPVFCGGKDLEEVSDTVARLQAHGIGPILDYAAEADVQEPGGPRSRQEDLKDAVARSYPYLDETGCEAHAEAFISCIDEAAQAWLNAGAGAAANRPPPFAAVKVTALGDPQLLQRLSDLVQQDTDKDKGGGAGQRNTPGGTSGEGEASTSAHFIADLRAAMSDAGWSDQEMGLVDNLVSRARRVVERAREKGVSVMIDAEQTYFQAAIDFIAADLMRIFNLGRATPLVFQTCQAYRTDAHDRLQAQLAAARAGGYSYGVKVVRGAYMVMERARAESMGYPSPIWPTLAATHASYDQCLRTAVKAVAEGQAAVVCATHNEASVALGAREMKAAGLATDSSPVYFAQLLGMADHVTFSLAGQGYRCYKYVPYGPVLEVVPYLLRRAQENSSVSALAARELGLLRDELMERALGPALDNPARSIVILTGLSGLILIVMPLAAWW